MKRTFYIALWITGAVMLAMVAFSQTNIAVEGTIQTGSKIGFYWDESPRTDDQYLVYLFPESTNNALYVVNVGFSNSATLFGLPSGNWEVGVRARVDGGGISGFSELVTFYMPDTPGRPAVVPATDIMDFWVDTNKIYKIKIIGTEP